MGNSYTKAIQFQSSEKSNACIDNENNKIIALSRSKARKTSRVLCATKPEMPCKVIIKDWKQQSYRKQASHLKYNEVI